MALYGQADAGTILVRRDIWSLETPNIWDPITLAYARAVQELQSRPVREPTSWIWQANIHGTYDSPPAGALWNQCQHASWFFFPWHRMYIYWFEQIVRSVVLRQGGPSDWALPYWNYSKGFPSNTLPPAFRERRLPDGSPNPLFVAQRNASPPPGINGGAQLPERATSHAFGDSFINFIPPPSPGFGGGRSPAMQFENATGAIENQPHNIVHGLVGGATSANCTGGLMSDVMCAARDPIFWLHHSNIDRLWNQWMAMGGGRANPSDTAWTSQQFTFYRPDGTTVTMTCADVVNTVRQLNYRYDDDPPLVARRGIARDEELVTARGAAVDPELLAASESGVELGSAPITVELTVPAETRSALSRAVAEDAGTSRLRLEVEGIEVDEDPGIVYELYLNPPDAASEAPDESHFVGHVSFFGAKRARTPGEETHVHGGVRHTFDVSSVVQDLRAQGRWDEDRLTVSFVPLGLLPPPDYEPTEEAATTRAAPEPQPAVRIARVSIVQE